MLKKFGLILLAVLLVSSLAFVGCGSSGNGDPDPGTDDPIGDLPDTLEVPANFEYDSTYTPPGQGWAGGPNPAMPKGYQIMIYPFTSAIVAGDVFEITMKFKLSRAVENIELTIVDTAANAQPNNYWTDLTVTYPRPDPEPDGLGKFDNEGEGLEADTEYDYEVTYVILHQSRGAVSGDDANVGINFYLEAEHLDTYTLVADAADDIITITFVEFEVVKNPDPDEGELTGPQIAAKATIEQAFEDFEDEIIDLVGDISDWDDDDWYAFFTGLEEGELEAIIEAIDLLYNPPITFPYIISDEGYTYDLSDENKFFGWNAINENALLEGKYFVIENVVGTIGMVLLQYPAGDAWWLPDFDVSKIQMEGSDAWILIEDLLDELDGELEAPLNILIGTSNPWGAGAAEIDVDGAYITDQDPS